MSASLSNNRRMTPPNDRAAGASLINELESVLSANRVKTRLIDLLSYAPDAGFYQLVPKAVVQPTTEDEIKAIFRIAEKWGVPVTFRAGGTSLSGQAVTDGILVDISQHWRKIEVGANGETVRVQPAVIGSHVNARLRPFSRKMGPDPASINSAMMGGIISNNASGMCCGVKQNSYHTLEAIRFILPNGMEFSTEIAADYQRFEKDCPELAAELLRLRQQLLTSPVLLDKIRHKYQIKNTVGYAINALLDFEQALDIFAHLLVGAEGTLAFVAEAVLKTVPDYPYKATALLFFPDIFAACASLEAFTSAGAQAIELMDRASLRSVEHIKGVPAIIRELPETAAALLVEFQAGDSDSIKAQLQSVVSLIRQFPLLEEPEFSTEPAIQALYWKVRKGLFPSVGAVRARGTTVILEDVAVPVPFLGKAISDLQALFVKYQYDNAIIFGHAKDGNIHFVVTQSFDTEAEIVRYDQFIREVVTMIAGKYQGSLKAEHGTGRNMAPFVETEWGPELYAIMKSIKEKADPHNLLNPGVIIHPDSNAHIQHLKKMPQVEEEVDRCIECGFCEHKCPSRDLTLTPRRRIVVRRALQLLKKENAGQQYDQLLSEYQYDGLDTCAVDGLCATACPVDIDTGKLVKRLRQENHGRFSNFVANRVARNFRFTEWTVRKALQTGSTLNTVLGRKTMSRFTKFMRKIIPSFPRWTDQLAPAGSYRKIQKVNNASGDNSIVYFPACINRTMGEAEGGVSVITHFSNVARKAGIGLFIPPDLSGSCCGQIFSSKGFADAFAFKANEFVDKLWNWSLEGRRPVVIDFSSCLYTAIQSSSQLNSINQQRLKKIRLMETIQFLDEYVLPQMPVIVRKKSIALHSVCSLEKMGIQSTLTKVAAQFADEVLLPANGGCCGMAGDRGFLFPELTQSACADAAAELAGKSCDGYYSTSRTCEMALSEAVGKNYHSIMRLADECMA
ncbi:MAG: FAD-binding and (Fe-S)-binding domain-containing protein [Chitinophagaceae bacterium]